MLGNRQENLLSDVNPHFPEATPCWHGDCFTSLLHFRNPITIYLHTKSKKQVNEKAYVQKSATYAFLTKIKNCYVECCLAYVFRVLLPGPHAHQAKKTDSPQNEIFLLGVTTHRYQANILKYPQSENFTFP